MTIIQGILPLPRECFSFLEDIVLVVREVLAVQICFNVEKKSPVNWNKGRDPNIFSVEYFGGEHSLHRFTKAFRQSLKCRSHLIDVF